ncbi:MAG: hypothetical protein JXR78_03375 [Victivallales bacterium]|nr:hypothetical protein [Victivallales bacterium]
MLKLFFCGSIIAASLWSSNAVAMKTVIANDKEYIDITAGEVLYPMILEEYNGKKCLVLLGASP